MHTPTAAYSIRLRVRMPNQPGSLGQFAVAVGNVGGNITRMGGFDVRQALLDEEFVIHCSSEAHMATVQAAVDALDGYEVLECTDLTFELHQGGKLEVITNAPIADRDDLSMAYTPGVARVCKAIEAEPGRVHDLTLKGNTIAIVTDGSAVLGLGDIGAAASLPVMEGKAVLFKEFAGVDGFPIALEVPRDVSHEERVRSIVESVVRIAPGFGGINLEDIAAPYCFDVETQLQELLDIPVFHDDQHGTAVVSLAALENALRVVGKQMSEISVVISGVGAAGVAIAKILMQAGVPTVIGADRNGAIHEGRTDLNSSKRWFAQNTNPEGRSGTLVDVLAGSDVFIGVSGPDLLTGADVATMAKDPIVFALANPDPEVRPEDCEGIAAVVATGRSDYPNQINNVLAFPGLFRGALDANATAITENMKLAAAKAIAQAVSSDDLSPHFIIPSVFDRSVVELVAPAVAAAAAADGVARA